MCTVLLLQVLNPNAFNKYISNISDLYKIFLSTSLLELVVWCYLFSWINWTNLMSLYESFSLLNMFRMLLHSSSGVGDCMWVYCSVSVCTGVLVWFGWSRVVSGCRLEHLGMLFIAQHVSNAITFILRSRRLYVGVLFCFGVYWCIGAVRLE